MFRIDQSNGPSRLLHLSPCTHLADRQLLDRRRRSAQRRRGAGIRRSPDERPRCHRAGYTYNTTELIRDRLATGAASFGEGAGFDTFTPKHILRVWASVSVWNAAGLPCGRAGVSAQSEYNALSSGYSVGWSPVARQGGYAVWNAQASYAFNERITVSLNGNNLFDSATTGASTTISVASTSTAIRATSC